VVLRAFGFNSLGRVLFGPSVGSLKLQCFRDEWERTFNASTNPGWEELQYIVHSNESDLWNAGCS